MSIKQFIPFIGGNKKTILKILGLVFLFSGLTAGLVLVQQRQNIREKAYVYDCIQKNQSCEFLGQTLVCCEGLSCQNGVCKSTGGGGEDGGDGDTAGCSSASAANCQGKSPGDTCKTGKKCKETGQSGKDGKPKCSCTDSSGGGGGSGGTTCNFGSSAGTSGQQCSPASAKRCANRNSGSVCDQDRICWAWAENDNSGRPKCSCLDPSSMATTYDTNGGKNPTKIGLFETGGEIVLFFKSFINSTPPKIALKKNSETCSLTDNDKILDTKNVSANGVLATGISVEVGEYLCIYTEDIGTSGGPYPMEGWNLPTGNSCGLGKVDISSLVSAAQSSGNTIFSKQCWGDYAKKKDCDFDDYALIVTVGSATQGGVTFLFRQQGITSKPASTIADQYKVNLSLKSGSSVKHKVSNATATVDDNGVWSIAVSKDDQDQSILTGIYDILIKGFSHLQKKFAGVNVNSTQVTIDKSKDQKDELKTADVNDDNRLTIEDVAKVSSYYTDFSVPVDKAEMYSSDINKDGVITIDDLALTVFNWSDFTVAGDE